MKLNETTKKNLIYLKVSLNKNDKYFNLKFYATECL